MDRAAVKGLARHMIAEAAPDELPLFDSLADASLDDPDRMRRGGSRQGGPLAADLAATVLTITPVVIAIASAMLNVLVEAGTKKAAHTVLDWLRGLWGRRRRETGPAAEPVPSDLATLGARLAAQGIDIRAMVRDEFLAHGWSGQRAEEATDIVAGLFLDGR